MCDENDQLPDAAPVYTYGGTAGRFAGSNPLRHCVACGYWHNGYHACSSVTLAPDTGFAVYPQAVPVWSQPARTNFAAVEALRRLADELARLTLNTPQEEQAGVWAAYYDLQATLTGSRAK